MGDEVHEVPRGVPFSQPRRADSVGARERLLEEQERRQQKRRGSSGGGAQSADSGEPAVAGRAEEAAGEAGEAGLEDLERAVGEANARLERAGRGVRLALAQAEGRPVVDILVPDPEGVLLVRRRIAPDEMAVWVARIESNEGLLLDETL